jgi:dihydroorotate dehydrogenase electron transfer subunit
MDGGEAGAPRAQLLETRQVVLGQWLQLYEAPSLVSGAQPGQFASVTIPDWSGLALRRAFSLNTIDRAAGLVSLHIRATDRTGAWLAGRRPGDEVDLHGPLGRGLEVDPKSHHLLLVVAGAGMPGVRALADEAIAAGRRVTVLLGATTAAQVYPSSLLPDEVEYVVATEDGSLGHRGTVTDLVPDYEAWADQAFASGPPPMLGALATLARGRDGRLGVARLGRKGGPRPLPSGTPQARRRSWLQVILEQGIVCSTATCLGCVVNGASGPLRTCREGPAFAAGELAWDEAP